MFDRSVCKGVMQDVQGRRTKGGASAPKTKHYAILRGGDKTMEYEEYVIIYEGERYVAVDKSDLITLWSLLLFDHRGEQYKILSPSGEVIVSGRMKVNDMKLLERR